jgi:hypothetical protein
MKLAIARELCLAMQKLGAPPALLALIGSMVTRSMMGTY